MAIADETSYEEMIQALQQYLSRLNDHCETLSAAAEDCIDNMEGDVNAEKASGRVQTCVKKISDNFETVQGIIDGLQRELDDLRNTASMMDDDE